MTWKRLLGVPFLLTLALWGLIVWGVSLVWSQGAGSPPPVPACETVAGEQYRLLVTDQLLPPAQPGQTLTPAQQLTMIASQLRIVTTQYNTKLQQLLITEGNVAVREEQLRQLRESHAVLQAEVEKLKPAAPSPPAPDK